VEFRGYGVPYDHRISRFEEAFTITERSLADGEIDFEGQYSAPATASSLPAVQTGRAAAHDRLDGADARHHSALREVWNVWHTETHNSPEGRGAAAGPGRRRVRGSGPGPRPRSEATVVVLVRMPGGQGGARATARSIGLRTPLQGRRRRWPRSCAPTPCRRGPVQLVVDPITIESLEALAPALELLDRG